MTKNLGPQVKRVHRRDGLRVQVHWSWTSRRPRTAVIKTAWCHSSSRRISTIQAFWAVYTIRYEQFNSNVKHFYVVVNWPRHIITLCFLCALEALLLAYLLTYYHVVIFVPSIATTFCNRRSCCPRIHIPWLDPTKPINLSDPTRPNLS